MSSSDWLSQPQNALSGLAALAPQPSALNGLAALAPTRSILDGLGAAPPIPSALSGLSALGSFGFGGSALPQVLPAPAAPLRWVHVRRRFNALLEAIAITPDQANDGMTKIGGITACLNRIYWGHADTAMNAVLAGSWARQTRVRPSQDIDLIFILPDAVYWRFEARAGNRQSQLLQEVKQVLGATYSRTDMRGDGQVVVVHFGSIKVEVVPAFRLTNGQLWACNTNDGGRYVLCDPWAQADSLAAADVNTNGNARHLTRLAKLWAREQSVPLKSYVLERLAIAFLATWLRIPTMAPVYSDLMASTITI